MGWVLAIPDWALLLWVVASCGVAEYATIALWRDRKSRHADVEADPLAIWPSEDRER